jgi:hypothetical protein
MFPCDGVSFGVFAVCLLIHAALTEYVSAKNIVVLLMYLFTSRNTRRCSGFYKKYQEKGKDEKLIMASVV